jgi:putative transposase
MARIARLVIPGIPHHVIQRGNRKEKVFFEDGDYARYLAFLKEGAEKSGTSIWAYCLMPNHVHIIAVPSHADGLRAMFADAHRRYTNHINWRHGWTGHLWQGRFRSAAMDEDHMAEAVRYVLLNPVRARLAKLADDWPHSSIHAHIHGNADPLIDPRPLADRFGDLSSVLESRALEDFDALRQSEKTGRPLGAAAWLKSLEPLTGRSLLPGKRGPKPKH